MLIMHVRKEVYYANFIVCQHHGTVDSLQKCILFFVSIPKLSVHFKEDRSGTLPDP